MISSTRREFLHRALAVSGVALAAGTVPGIEPIKRAGKSNIRLSIASYSYRDLLNLKLKPPPMTLDDMIDQAAAMDLDAVSSLPITSRAPMRNT